MNDSEFNALVDTIQAEVFAEAKEALGEVGFQRWRNPRFNGRLTGADGQARLAGSCGDTMEIFLKFVDNRVAQASYTTDGCGASSVCGSFTAELALGKTPDELYSLKPKDVLGAIGTFPKEEEHCAHLAVRTLQKAVNSYLRGQGEKG